MPRLTQSLPKYRKHKASGQAFVEFNGRQYYLGPHGTRTGMGEYDRLIAEWLQHGRHIQPQAARQAACIGLINVTQLVPILLLPCRLGEHLSAAGACPTRACE
jgi:hypothetical protein